MPRDPEVGESWTYAGGCKHGWGHVNKGGEEGPDRTGLGEEGSIELKSQAVKLNCLGSNPDAVIICCVPLSKELTTPCFDFFPLSSLYLTGNCEK